MTEDFESVSRQVAAAVDRSVAESVGQEKRIGVAFSGGLDSSTLVACAKKRAKVVAFTAFAKGARDDAKAGRAAEALGADFVAIELSPEMAAESFAKLALPFEPTLMDRSLWCLYTTVSRKANEAGLRVMLLGQLADELFGGYAKYAKTLEKEGERVARTMMSSDYREYASRGRVRDVGACSPWVEPRLPFESGELADLAASVPTYFLIRDGVRKAVLRRAAAILGVPEEIAGAPKKAAQYSSGVQKLVASLRF